MKIRPKYSFIFAVVLIVLALNILAVVIFAKNASLSAYSIAPAGAMAVMIANGIFACIFKNKGNYLVLRRRRGFGMFSEDKEYTFSDEYEREFRIMLLVYCAAIPFYIPLIFFPNGMSAAFLTMLVLSLPQVIFIIFSVKKTVDEAKARKQRDEQLERERAEQERREELGRWK